MAWNLRRLGEYREGASRSALPPHPRWRGPPEDKPGSAAGLSQLFRGQIGRGEDRLTGLARSWGGSGGRHPVRGRARVRHRVGERALRVVAGSRHLITLGVPAIAEMVEFPSSSPDLLWSWRSRRTAGLGSRAPAPTALGPLGRPVSWCAGTLGLLRLVLTAGSPLGCGLAPAGGRDPLAPGGRIACLLVYAAVPVPYNVLANGSWGALVPTPPRPAGVAAGAGQPVGGLRAPPTTSIGRGVPSPPVPPPRPRHSVLVPASCRDPGGRGRRHRRADGRRRWPSWPAPVNPRRQPPDASPRRLGGCRPRRRAAPAVDVGPAPRTRWRARRPSPAATCPGLVAALRDRSAGASSATPC